MTWSVRNSGTCTWNSGYSLRYVSKTNQQISLSQGNVSISGAVAPGQSYSFSVPMRVPTTTGTHREDWGLFTGNGQKFYDAWVQIVAGAPPVMSSITPSTVSRGTAEIGAFLEILYPRTVLWPVWRGIAK
jgi:hypothetical protein